MHHLPPRIATLCGVLLLGATTGCVDPSRVDALDQNLARVRAETAQRDAQIQWLRWGQMVLSNQVQLQVAVEREATARKVAALEVQNAALVQRLQRAEQKLGLERTDPPAAPARKLDEVSPYNLAGFQAAPRAADKPEEPVFELVKRASARAPSRTLDETVPY